jgi:hypothetical protein
MQSIAKYLTFSSIELKIKYFALGCIKTWLIVEREKPGFEDKVFRKINALFDYFQFSVPFFS